MRTGTCAYYTTSTAMSSCLPLLNLLCRTCSIRDETMSLTRADGITNTKSPSLASQPHSRETI